MSKAIELTDENLSKVTGGIEGPDPSTYIYKGVVNIKGVHCKKDPNDLADDVCIVNQYSIIYVTRLNCGSGYVETMFKGDKHREYGYILETYITKQ